MECNFQDEKTRGKVAPFQPNVILLGLSPSDYVLRALSNVQTSDLEQTLLVRYQFAADCLDPILIICM